MALIVIPLWTSFLIRTYAWMFLLGSQRGTPDPRITGVRRPRSSCSTRRSPSCSGIVYNYLPLMVLPIYVSLERLDKSLLEARATWEPARSPRFRQVTFPLSMPGVVSGCLLVFIPVMGEYLIPVLLGGGKTYFLGNALADLFLQSTQLAVRLGDRDRVRGS